MTYLEESYFYTVKELAFIWNVSRETVRRLVMNEPDVMLISNGRPGKRPYHLIRIPGHVAIRLERRMKVVSQLRQAI